MTLIAFLILFTAVVIGYILNLRAARALRNGGATMHSLDGFHGGYAALLVLIPTFGLIILWLLFQGAVIEMIVQAGLPDDRMQGLGTGEVQLIMAEIRSIAGGRIFGDPAQWKLDAADRLITLQAVSSWLLLALTAALAAYMLYVARGRVAADFRARQGLETIVHRLMLACATTAIFVTIGIVASLLFETIRFFNMVPFWEFVLGTNWEPQIPIREGQIAAEGAFGMLPVFLGTLVIATVAMFIATPVGLLSAIYLHEFANHRVRAVVKPVLEVLAGVPTVVYGFFAILVIAPALRNIGGDLGIPVAPNTALAAGSVMGIMLIPFISSFADDALGAVPRSLRDGSLAVGATQAETMLKVLFPAAIPGIVGGILLAVSRAIGETMIVVMAAGLIAKMTINPLDSVTTVTVQIVTLLIGDTAFDSPKTLAAFALGMVLFVMTLFINIAALRIVRKYREIYD
ncbi:phosphate ABC transporter permease subunit PstC [Roseovarius sp. D22-M7]|uniref:phosphate ABC transporter permease subunit PstC n=1 Tax=Roseovarius sp. D22-M7 TaxID=3127116 RepID=UPI00300FD1FA